MIDGVCKSCVHLLVCKYARTNAGYCGQYHVICKDCKYWWRENELCVHPKCCDGNVAVVEAQTTHFCSYGERKI